MGASSTRTKVFYFIPTLVQGGSERQILELVRRLPERFEPVVCLYQDKIHYRHLLPAGQPKYVLDNEGMTVAGFRRLVAAMRAEQPAIVHSYLDRANFWGRLAALRARVPVVISSCRARMMEPQYLLAERFLAKRSALVIVNSIGIERELHQRARVPRDRIRVIHNFLDLDHFRPPTADERQQARQRWGLDDEQRVLLMPGRISMQKHQVGLLLALDRLARAGRLPADVVVLLAGRRSAVAVDRLVARIAGRRRLRGQVRLLGNQVDVRSLYWAADVLTMPSLWEGLPNAVLEGSSCGLPGLVSHAANLDALIEPNVGGWEVPTGNHWALADVLARDVLSTPRAALREMGQNNRQRMERCFAPARVLEDMLGVYDALLSGERGVMRQWADDER